VRSVRKRGQWERLLVVMSSGVETSREGTLDIATDFSTSLRFARNDNMLE
jgi:hypothetical protein